MTYAHSLIVAGVEPEDANQIMDALLQSVSSNSEAGLGVYLVVLSSDEHASKAVARYLAGVASRVMENMPSCFPPMPPEFSSEGM